MKQYFGIDVGGTDIKYGIVSEKGEVSRTGKIETPKSQAELIQALQGLVNLYPEVVYQGVGLSMPGIIRNSQMITSGALTYLNVKTFSDELTAGISVPVRLVNDANAVALAEKWCGNAMDLTDFACITLGTAVGGSFYLNDALYEGAKGLAGEFGISYTIGLDNPTLVDSVSAKCGVVAGACRVYSEKSGIPTRNFEEIINKGINGEALAQEVVDAFCKNNAELLYALGLTLGTQAILIGGSVSNNDMIMNRIKEMYMGIITTVNIFPKETFPEIRVCQHKANSGILGSVYAFQSL